MPPSGNHHSVPVAANPIDWAQLARATLGDRRLAREVLNLFDIQAATLAAALRDLPPDAAALAHKLKGSAQGIGAAAVAQAAEALEVALLRPGDPRPLLARLLQQLDAARMEIAKQAGPA